MVNSKNNSRSPRLGLQLSIRFYLEDDAPLQLTTRNISNTGLFIDCTTPLDISVGKEAYVELAEALGDGAPQKVLTRIVRIEKEGFALKYIEA